MVNDELTTPAHPTDTRWAEKKVHLAAYYRCLAGSSRPVLVHGRSKEAVNVYGSYT